MSLNMLIETPGGVDYTAAQCAEWMRQADFKSTRSEHLAEREFGRRHQVDGAAWPMPGHRRPLQMHARFIRMAGGSHHAVITMGFTAHRQWH